MESKFQIAIIVLVVLAQLGGALVTAWKKRQAAQRDREARQGGLVVVQQEQEPARDSWGKSSPNEESAPNSWETDDDWEDENYGRERHDPWEETPPPAPAEHPAPVGTKPSTAPHVPSWLARDPSAGARGGAVAATHATAQSPGLVHQAGQKARTSRVRSILNRDSLRAGLVAQIVLAPPVLARGIRR